MTELGWGLGEWGLSPYGTDPNLLLESAVAITTHSVMVTTSRSLRISSAIALGDALNPATWTVSRVTTGAAYTPTLVQKLSERRVLITLREPLASWNYYHRVGSTTLQAANLVLVSAPYYLDFRGVLSTTATSEPDGIFDLFTSDVVGGSLQTTEAGGYARVYGVDVIRKLIFRRLTTMPGSFFYLSDSEYGVGLKIKGILRTHSLAALQREITDEIAREPGVIEVKVRLSLGSGVLSIHVRARTDLGEVETTVTAS